jgi:hypothetical protein
MDMSSYFHSSHSDDQDAVSDAIGIEIEQTESQAPESQLLLKIILLALDDLMSRKKNYKISAVLFFESGTFEYYLNLLGLDDIARVAICDHLDELIEQARLEAGMCSMHDRAWVMERLNRETRRRVQKGCVADVAEVPPSRIQNQAADCERPKPVVLFRASDDTPSKVHVQHYQAVLAF